jgi:hypothetical protein
MDAPSPPPSALTRRGLMAALPLVVSAPLIRPAAARPDSVAGVPSSGKLAFSVFRKGSRIGEHRVAFTQAADRLTVHTHAHFSVGLGPINFFNYVYDVTEVWEGGQLSSVSASTNDNGHHDSCTARRGPGGLVVTGSKSGQYVAPKGSIAGTHWNRAELGAPVINPENGVLMHFIVHNDGRDQPPGGGAPATHYALRGFATLDLWYADNSIWSGLRAVAKDGSVITYRAA